MAGHIDNPHDDQFVAEWNRRSDEGTLDKHDAEDAEDEDGIDRSNYD